MAFVLELQSCKSVPTVLPVCAEASCLAVDQSLGKKFSTFGRLLPGDLMMIIVAESCSINTFCLCMQAKAGQHNHTLVCDSPKQ